MHASLTETPRNTSHQYRCIFVHIPKAAGTSIKKLFDMPGRGHVAWHYYAICYPELWEQYTSFTVVRNPWDRAVSAYHFAKMKDSYWHNARLLPPDYQFLSNKSFEECLSTLHEDRDRLIGEAWHSQSSWVAAPRLLGGELMVDRVLRFETLDHDFAELCRELGAQAENLPRLNPSNRSLDYRQYYNDRSRKLVELIYQADIEAFGYSF
jgi:hypothetical protein